MSSQNEYTPWTDADRLANAESSLAAIINKIELEQVGKNVDSDLNTVIKLLKAIRVALDDVLSDDLAVTSVHVFEGTDPTTPPEQVAQELQRAIELVTAGECREIYSSRKLIDLYGGTQAPLYVIPAEPISAGNLPPELQLNSCPHPSETSSLKELTDSAKTPSSKVSYSDLVTSNPFTSKSQDCSSTILGAPAPISDDQIKV